MESKGISPSNEALANYLKSKGGNRIIDTVLIANNGIAAVKCIRSIRKWAYDTLGDERAVQFVAMATPEDLRVNAEFIRMADQVEEVPGGSNDNNYANVNLIVDIAVRRGCQAVWAGWGHASENPRLPESLHKNNIAFMGPPAKAMKDLGDKIASTLVAQSANVSCVPWNGMEVKVNYAENGIPEEVYTKATISSLEEAQECLKKIGFPAMIKASEGGGGKGIRRVTNDSEVESCFRQVQGEVPGSPIFIMKMVSKCRHLEVQILADAHGEAIALYGRDCSVQRRHQKIIEEGPPIIAPKDVRDEMEAAAVRMTKAVGYVSVGTVEYLYEPATNKYYFLELNPRLQVEHPVTEGITGVNLPACQLHVAMGIPLYRIPQIRKFYNQDPNGDSKLSFAQSERAEPKGHVIAVRVTGENPEDKFKPTSGGIRELTFRTLPNVWGYFSVQAHGGLHEYADSQFGHIFAHGIDREHARKELALALRQLSIRGDISTPVAYVSHLLESDDFSNNLVTTHWLDHLIAEETQIEKKPDRWLVVMCGALFKAWTKTTERVDSYLSLLGRGQVPQKDLLKMEDVFDLIYNNVKYVFKAVQTGPSSYMLSLDAKSHPKATSRVHAEVRPLNDGGLLILFPGKSSVCYGSFSVTGLKLVVDGRTCQFTNEVDPGQLRTNTAGKLVRYLVENGTHIPAKTAYAEMEVMKMYLPLLSTESGVINFIKPEGSVLEPGAIIATLTLDDPSKVKKASLVTDEIPSFKAPGKYTNIPKRFFFCLNAIERALAGYLYPDIASIVDEFYTLAFHHDLSFVQFKELFDRLGARLPNVVHEEIGQILNSCGNSYCDGVKILDSIQKYAKSCENAKQKQKDFVNMATPFVDLCEKFKNGAGAHLEAILLRIFTEFSAVEEVFCNSRDHVLSEQRQKHKDALMNVFTMDLSHHQFVNKNRLILLLLNTLETNEMVKSDKLISRLTGVLTKFAELPGAEMADISLKARQLMTRDEVPSFESRLIALKKEISSEKAIKECWERLITSPTPIFDLLSSLFFDSNKDLALQAMEVYIRRAYRAYNIKAFHLEPALNAAEWSYVPSMGVDYYAPDKESILDDKRRDFSRILTDDNLKGLASSNSSESNLNASVPHDLYYGKSISFNSEEEMYNISKFEKFLDSYAPQDKESHNILIVIANQTTEDGDSVVSEKYSKFLFEFRSHLRQLRIKRVTLLVAKFGAFPRVFTFRERLHYKEHTMYRHVEPPLAHQLELNRLSNYNVELVSTDVSSIHVFFAEEKTSRPDKHTRIFARALIRGGSYEPSMSPNSKEYLQQVTKAVVGEAEKVLTEAFKAIELTAGDARFKHAWSHHIYMHFIPEVVFDPDKVVGIIGKLAKKYERKLGKLNVGEVELVARLRTTEDAVPTAVRFIITNPTQYKFSFDAYMEMREVSKNRVILHPLFGSRLLDGKEISEPYPVPNIIQKKRHQAKSSNTTYIYDFIEIFSIVLEKVWEEKRQQEKSVKVPAQFVVAKELILDQDGNLQEVSRPFAQNNIAMVAWKLTLFTPEFPSGRPVIVIGNDITNQIGSFGPKEDVLFKKVSEFSRKAGLPRIYIAANSGARIGLAQEVKDSFKVEWNDATNPSKGFKNLYVDENDYQKLSKSNSVLCKQNGEKHVITDIIGQEDGLGVENLQGSGMIAGETSQAYLETFTLNLVTGRTVGIGAYLVRLGQRVIQNKAPIVLTGFEALNKVLGSKVYLSNAQIGGTQIMGRNGVSHLVVNDDVEGVASIVQWLSFVPFKQGSLPTMIPSLDPIDRPIEFYPTKAPYDPREMLAGKYDNGVFISGFFDKDSFVETMPNWGKTVVTGRARLGGIPMGVIAVETRTSERVTPADPALLDSHENKLQQAGQVWFPDSSFKTAQAIKDFNYGEELPLMIFANWRGFSGGLRDLFDEILKFGSYIVDNLREYKQPVFIYIPPFAELRGGAWVVLDPQINPTKMEMYCDENGRGGVLEPSGTVEIKYRDRDLKLTMHRLDPVLQKLDKELAEVEDVKKAAVQEKIRERERELTPSYSQIATAFADLHDTPGRMKAKNVINEVLSWKHSRTFFYFRVKRRIFEEFLKKKIVKIQPSWEDEKVTSVIKSWIATEDPVVRDVFWKDDKKVTSWLESNPEQWEIKLEQLKKQVAKEQFSEFVKSNATLALEAILENLPSTATSSEQKQLLEKLKKSLETKK